MLHRAWTEYCNIYKNFEKYWGLTPMIECNLGKMWKTRSPRCPKNTFPKFFALRFLRLISNGLNGVNINSLWLCYKFLCRIFSKSKQPIDFIKPNVIRKLAYKVKYISQINEGLIMFYWIFENKNFLNYLHSIERINTRKRNTINIVQCSKFSDNFPIT